MPNVRKDDRGSGNRLKVLHVQKVKGLGGSERHLLALLPALVERGLEVRMMVLAEGDWSRFADPLEAAGVEVVSMVAGGDFDPRISRAVGREIRTFEPSLVHTHLIHGAVHGQLAASRRRVPSVATFHDVDPRLRRPPALWAVRFAGRRAACTIAISDHVRGFLEELRIALPDSIRTVPYGIDPDGWRLPPGTRDRARAALNLADRDVAVVIAARLIPGKGHDVLLDALVPAIRRAPNLRLLIAGDGPARPALEAQARSLPRGTVRFLGFVDRPRELIGASDISVFPTLATLGEGFGLAALEAMAAALPVVASDAGALPEVVDDGRSGLVVRAGNVEALAEALARLGTDPPLRAQMGEAGLARARQRFSLAAMVDRTVAVYAEALGNRA
jgi:glycosyltransferase involved in cell wall biosynthesis